MPDDTLRRALKGHETLWRQLQPLSVQIEALQRFNAGIHSFIEEADRTGTLIRAALGPVEDLRRSVQLNTELLDVATELRGFRRLGVEMEKRFLLPELPDIPVLLESLEMGRTARALSHSRDDMSRFRQAIEAMSTPWLDSQNQLRSLTGLLGLQHIGHELHSKPVFNVESAERLRHYLGDWRARIDWPSAIFTDALVRSEFYLERGLDPDPSYFPAIAFDQAITNAGVKRAPPPYVPVYDHADDRRGEEDAGFARTNAAHDRLQRFESHLRAFIDQRMTATIGENWIKHRVPGDKCQQWKVKQAKALDAGESKQPLIAYADFTDYLKIIERKDNWDQVFASVFRRKSLVQESLQRLYPIRVCTMHARIITQDDELYLHAETTRLLRAMGIQA